MRWQGQRRSRNVEDRRGRGGGRLGVPLGGGGGLKLGGGMGIIVLLIGLYFGVDLTGIVGSNSSGGLPRISGQPVDRSNDEAADFVTSVLGTTEDVWSKLFQQAGQTYRPPKLVLFSDVVQSACGTTSSAAGPFYCPGDDQVYIDLSFFRQLQAMGASGDFAQAYVIAHEVGHHVQNLLGVSMAVQQRRQQVGKAEGNALSVRAELQADCYAGVWAHHAHKDFQLLEAGDLEEGMNAAAKIGDDALMSQAGSVPHPESFTHGSSEQRQQWLYRGLETGDPQACDTFGSAI
ncbi:MAG: hypothetical protein CSB44_05640 [Gammaproteobacteria bacterium]|nr:MAG: hypothetical protein CSB44_05640 [Gammaproteobacteria bacterium]PIE37787.1 MAG: hypothetical protein CSA54_00670 [Gammaproteobacteria bacterium]